MSTSTWSIASSQASLLPSEPAGDPLRGEPLLGEPLLGEPFGEPPLGEPLGEPVGEDFAGSATPLLAAAFFRVRMAPCPELLRCFHSQRFFRM